MSGGKKRHRAKLASWSKVAGDEPQPEDAQQGQWTRTEREQMDEKFCRAMTAALRHDDDASERPGPKSPG